MKGAISEKYIDGEGKLDHVFSAISQTIHYPVGARHLEYLSLMNNLTVAVPIHIFWFGENHKGTAFSTIWAYGIILLMFPTGISSDVAGFGSTVTHKGTAFLTIWAYGIILLMPCPYGYLFRCWWVWLHSHPQGHGVFNYMGVWNYPIDVPYGYLFRCWWV